MAGTGSVGCFSAVSMNILSKYTLSAGEETKLYCLCEVLPMDIHKLL